VKRFSSDARDEGLTERFELTAHQPTLQQVPHAASAGSSGAGWAIP